MDEKMLSTLRAVISTLDGIEVHGRANLDKLLACIMTLTNIINQRSDEHDH